MSLVACPTCRSVVLSRDVRCPFCRASMKTIASSGAIKATVGAFAGVAVLASGIGCAYGAPCTNNNCMPVDGGRDITIGDVDGGKMDSSLEAASDATSDSPSDASMESSSSSDAADAKTD